MAICNLQIPINSVSFGQVASSILYKLYEVGEVPNLNIFPIVKQVDFSSFSYDKDFYNAVIKQIEGALESYNSSDRTFKLWHIQGAQEKVGDKSTLLTFHETDSLTPIEVNILRNQKKVLVTSKYTKAVFESYGLENIEYFPLWFDDFHFKRTNRVNKKYTTFGLYGKLEKRKAHIKTIKAWVKAYGGNNDYRLNCCINNQFLANDANLPPAEKKIKLTEHTKMAVAQALEKEGLNLPLNVNFLHTEEKNSVYNNILNASDIVLGMSHCEGFDLPLFQSLCLGKKAVVFDAHVHKDYCDKTNSVLVQPNGKKIDAVDNIFFQKGAKYNQGQWEDWNEDDLISAMKVAEEKEFVGRDLSEDFKFKNIFTNDS